jgi:hypothetical protein
MGYAGGGMATGRLSLRWAVNHQFVRAEMVKNKEDGSVLVEGEGYLRPTGAGGYSGVWLDDHGKVAITTGFLEWGQRPEIHWTEPGPDGPLEYVLILSSWDGRWLSEWLFTKSGDMWFHQSSCYYQRES